MAARARTVEIGKIVRSESHVRYTCQIFGPGEHAVVPEPSDFAFASFVRVPLRVNLASADVALSGIPPADSFPTSGRAAPAASARFSAIGLVYDTILVNPAFGALGPRLSNDDQAPLFSPDYLSERATLVSILLLGTIVQRQGGARVAHGAPPVAPDLGAVVSILGDEEVRGFHVFADGGAPGGPTPYLHMGYLPHAIAQGHPLMPLAILSAIDRLERLCPENHALLSIVKRNFSWRLKVQATG